MIGFYYYEFMASPFDYHQSFFYVSFHWTGVCSDILGDLRLSGSIIRKSRFIFTKERRTINTPRTRVCAIYRTPLGCYEYLIRSDLFIFSSLRSDKAKERMFKSFKSFK